MLNQIHTHTRRGVGERERENNCVDFVRFTICSIFPPVCFSFSKLLLLEFVNSLSNKWCMSNAFESPAAIYLIEISQTPFRFVFEQIHF